MTVVLDLDETLVCSYRADCVPGWLKTSGVLPSFKVQYGSDPSTCSVLVYERPGLREFLARASRVAELVLFTAGIPAYARPVADFLDPVNKVFQAKLYRDACVTTEWRENVKDLSLLGRNLSRTVLIDNSPYSFLLQPCNGIPCLPYRGNPQDNQLLRVILPLIESLSLLADIRPVLRERFCMEKWFAHKGVTAHPRGVGLG